MQRDSFRHRIRLCRELLGHPTTVATALFALIALILTGPALIGRAALAPDRILDWDPLYRTEPDPPPPPVTDYTPTVIDFPRDLRFARGLRAGRLDMWNPLSGCGAPLWAEQGGPFFPLKWLFYVSPSRATYYLFLTFRLIAAALGAYFLARRRGLAHTPALAAGATFELSGTIVAYMSFAAGSALFLLPWVILGSYAIADTRSLSAAAGTAIALGVTASTGHPTLILMVLAAFGVAVLGHMARAWRRPRVMLTIGLHAGLATVLGLALAAPSLLPFAELWRAGSSYKTRPIGLWVWNLNLAVSRLAVLPAFYASSALRQAAGVREVADLSAAIGILGLVAAIAGVLRGRLDPALLGVAVLGVALTIAPPGLAWIHDFPRLTSRLILPIYAWPLVVLPLTQAAGNGVQAVSSARGWRVGVAAIVVFMAAALAVLIGTEVRAGPLVHLKQALAGEASVTVLLVPPLLAVGVFGACFVLQRTRLARFTAAGLVLAMVLEQLTIILPFCLQPASRVLTAPPSPAVQFLQSRLATGDGRMVALPYQLGFPLSPMLFGLADARGVSALPIRRYYHYLLAISQYAALMITVQDIPVVRSPLLDLAAVRCLVLPADPVLERAREMARPQRPDADDQTTPLVFQDERVLIYQNRAALPRVRIVHQAQRVRDEEAARQWAAEIGRHAEHAHELGLADSVILEPDETGQEAPGLPGGGQLTGERVRIVDQIDPDRLVIDAHLQAPGFVVVADTYYPGWHASIDSAPTPIFPANLLFRAVFVPAGTHTIVLRYAPTSFRLGLVVFAAAALVCGCCLTAARVTD